MSKCHDNRKLRQRRNKKFLCRLAEKRFGERILKANGGPSLDYYTLRVYPKVAMRSDVRVFHGYSYSLRPNDRYCNLMKTLLRMCRGITVQLPADMFAGKQ